MISADVCDAPSNNRYVRRRDPCRCPGCRAAHSVYERDRQRSIRRPDGRAPDRLIDAGEVAAHLRWLVSHGRGLGVKVIARSAGTTYVHLTRIMDGTHSTIRQSTADRLLSIGTHHAVLVDAAPLRRHLVKLHRRGWTPTRVAAVTGEPVFAVQQIKNGRTKRTNPQRFNRLMAFNPTARMSPEEVIDYDLP